MSNVSNSEYCKICRCRLDECCAICSECENEKNECPILEGTCGHKFHKHCIDKWLKNHPECPMGSCQNKSFLGNDNHTS